MTKYYQHTIHTSPKFVKLWKSMTPEERLTFARFANSTPGSLRQVIEGNRRASVELAVRIERASTKMGGDVQVNRTDLSPVCNRCEFARTCLKSRLW